MRLALLWLWCAGCDLPGVDADKLPLPWKHTASRDAEKLKRELPRLRDVKVEGAELRCEDRSRAAEPLADGCVTAELACGQIVEGHTEGGQSLWSDAFYRAHYCLPLPERYTGPERLYRLRVPADTRVKARLESPCADLDLFALIWSDDTCPTVDHLATECEADDHAGGGEVQVVTDRNPKTLLIGVDGKAGATGPFRLQVLCDSL